MAWNWQLKEWPHFTWDKAKLIQAENLFIENAGITIGISKHLSSADKEALSVETLSINALTTSEIEGEILNRESVQASIRKQLGLSYSSRRPSASESGISEMMVDLYKNLSTPLTEQTLFAWHKMISSGRRDLESIGEYRKHSDPMQIISGASYAPKVHYEAPPSNNVPREMKSFLTWFNNSNPKASSPLPPITRAAIAHLWFECIHPFEDGNGRIGRAISEMVLAQGLSNPIYTSISSSLLKNQKDYYKQLELSSRDLEITDWILWFSTIVLESQKNLEKLITFLIEKTRLLEKAKNHLNPRQEKVLLRMLAEGPSGFKGGLSAHNYSTIAGSTIATTTRDLKDLTDKGFLIKKGKLKGTRYFLNIPIK